MAVAAPPLGSHPEVWGRRQTSKSWTTYPDRLHGLPLGVHPGRQARVSVPKGSVAKLRPSTVIMERPPGFPRWALHSYG